MNETMHYPERFYEVDPAPRNLECIGYPDYYIYQNGDVHRIGTKKIVTHQYTKTNHVYVGLYSEGKQRSVGVAKANLIAYEGKHLDPKKTYILYRDGDSTNVNLENLVWATRVRAYNHHRSMRHKYGNRDYEKRPIEELRRRLLFDNVLHAAAYFLVDPFEIDNNLNGFGSSMMDKRDYDFRYR